MADHVPGRRVPILNPVPEGWKFARGRDRGRSSKKWRENCECRTPAENSESAAAEDGAEGIGPINMVDLCQEQVAGGTFYRRPLNFPSGWQQLRTTVGKQLTETNLNSWQWFLTFAQASSFNCFSSPSLIVSYVKNRWHFFGAGGGWLSPSFAGSISGNEIFFLPTPPPEVNGDGGTDRDADWSRENGTASFPSQNLAESAKRAGRAARSFLRVKLCEFLNPSLPVKNRRFKRRAVPRLWNAQSLKTIYWLII